MTPDYDSFGEDGFNAQDERNPDVSVVTPEQMARMEAFERLCAEAGYDIFGSPLPEREQR